MATFYLDIDDEITSAAARIRGTQDLVVVLVLPAGSRIATSRIEGAEPPDTEVESEE